MEEEHEKLPRIELKIPKVGAFTEESRNPSQESIRVCEDCGKVFSSGKAYGGHKRIHAQLKKEATASKPAPIKKDDLNLENYKLDFSYGEVVRCSECNRGFPSWKSLFGHMRSHPERAWRGIRRPPESHLRASNCSSSSTISWEEQDPMSNFSATAGSAVNLMESLKGSWSATGKRGRCALIKNSATWAEDTGDDEDKMKEAVNDLLMFSQVHQSDEEEISEESLSRDPTKKRRKKRKLTELDDEAAGDFTENASKGREFACDICNKQFPSHQALGGHKASHNKLRRPEAGPGMSSGWEDVGEAARHECNICSLSFSTRQALEGHKRRHWMGSPGAARATSNQGTGEGRRSVLDFDLNELPSVEDNDQVNVQSSSVCQPIS